MDSDGNLFIADSGNCAIREVANNITLASSSNPAICGQSVTLTASVYPNATGTITFMDGSTALDTETLSGGATAVQTVTYATSSLSVGSHILTAVYSGDSNYSPSTSNSLTEMIVLGDNSTINVPNDQTLTLSGITDAGTLVMTGGGTLVLAGQNTLTGDVTVDGGTLQLEGGSNIGTLTIDSGTLIVSGMNSVATLNNDGILDVLSGGYAMPYTLNNGGTVTVRVEVTSTPTLSITAAQWTSRAEAGWGSALSTTTATAR